MIWLETLPNDWWQSHAVVRDRAELIHELTGELLFLVRNLLLETRIYARTCKRSILLPIDFRTALTARSMTLNECSFNRSSSFEPEAVFVDSFIERQDQCSSPDQRIQLTLHWLAIDGEQPIIAENPPVNFDKPISTLENVQQNKIDLDKFKNVSPNIQKLFQLAFQQDNRVMSSCRGVHSLTMNNLMLKPMYPRQVSFRRTHLDEKLSTVSTIGHELSTEQQMYFQYLTENCFNAAEKPCQIAFHALTSDAALQPLLPRLVLFITKGIETNILLCDLKFIIQFLSILKMLTINKHIQFDKQLHWIISTLLTCLFCVFDPSKQSKDIPSTEKLVSDSFELVWILREQASDLLIYFIEKYKYIPRLIQRVRSQIKSRLDLTVTLKTYSTIYACLQTLIRINSLSTDASIIDIIQSYQSNEIFESDFDLDPTEQKSRFDAKLDKLINKHEQ